MQCVELTGAESKRSPQAVRIVAQRVEDPGILGRFLDQFGHSIKRHADTPIAERFELWSFPEANSPDRLVNLRFGGPGWLWL